MDYELMSGDTLWDVVGFKTATDVISCHMPLTTITGS
jgi:hypothetical protein